MLRLRDYQQDSIDRLRQSILRGNKAPLLVQPCGTGKTMVATEIIRKTRARGKKAVFYAPRRELVYQTSDALDAGAQMHGIRMAGVRQHWAGIQVASFDTVRSQRSRDKPLPRGDVVIIDEAHLSISSKRKEIIQEHLDQGAVVIGLTATPCRGDGRGLGEIYDDLIESRSVEWFIDNEYLVPARYYAPDKPDLEKVKIARGDYVVDQLGRVVDDPVLIGNIVTQWHRLAHGLSTVVFCVNRAHSRHVCEEFRKQGVSAEHVDGETPTMEREAILDRVRSGETRVLCNVFIATYGLDIPTLECAVLARPTKSLALYHQTLGRVMRISPGKEEAVVIDHAGATAEHGLFSDPVPWSLNAKEKVQDRQEQQRKERKEPKDITCPQCKHVFRARRDCPKCGFMALQPSEDVPYYEADLKELDTAGKRNRATPWEEKIAFMGGLKEHARKKGFKDGWAAHAYRKRFGVFPNDPRVNDAPPCPPNQQVMGHIKYLQIQNAKRKQANG